VTLTLKALNLGSAAAFLGLAPDPPPHHAIVAAVATLQDLKALDHNEMITSLGMKLAELPIEPRMGTAILGAALLGVAEPMVIMATLASSPPIFQDKAKGSQYCCTGPGQEANIARLTAVTSDHYTQLRIIWGLLNLDQWSMMPACMRLKLDFAVVNGVVEAVKQTMQMLKSMGAVSKDKDQGKGLLKDLGLDTQTDEERKRWGKLTFLMGMGL